MNPPNLATLKEALEIRTEIDALENKLQSLFTVTTEPAESYLVTAPKRRVFTATAPKRRVMSAATRRKISMAAKARWANLR